MFKSRSRRFAAVPCPGGASCFLPNCMFQHNLPTSTKRPSAEHEAAIEGAKSKSPIVNNNDGSDRKRVKLQDGGKAVAAAATPTAAVQGANGTKGAQMAGKKQNSAPDKRASSIANGSKPAPKSLSKPVTPPATASSTSSSSASRADILKRAAVPRATSKTAPSPVPARHEELNPRLIAQNPASHAVRLQYLRLIHGHMQRLNDQAGLSGDAAQRKKHLTPNGVVKCALDEEEHVARAQGAIYKTIMGHAVVRYKKMDLAGWLRLLAERTGDKDAEEEAAEKKRKALKKPVVIDTGLTPFQERLVLSRFRADLSQLTSHGFVTTPPTDADTAAATRAVEQAHNWETCDRCGSRFQCFPARRAVDGVLATGGECTYHWARAVRDRSSRESMRPCCGRPNGTPGCTTTGNHVFKTSDVKRLAASFPFAATPSNKSTSTNTTPHPAVAFDCEMGYTTLGMEVIRVSACSWPSGLPLLDVLVRPFGDVLDLNTRFSGVTPEQFARARELSAEDVAGYEYGKYAAPTAGGGAGAGAGVSQEKNKDGEDKDDNGEKPLPIASTPSTARTLLLSLLSPTTPLIGHSIENDLLVLRLLHPTIIDTVLLFPHPSGLPYRYGLRKLAETHLGRTIQAPAGGGEVVRGHDSMEDARATGDLVRRAVEREWGLLVVRGWGFMDDDGQEEDGEKTKEKKKKGQDKKEKHARQRGFVPPKDEEKKNMTAGRAFLEPPDRWWEVVPGDEGDTEMEV